MYYIAEYTQTEKGIDINNRRLVTEESDIVLTFTHATEKGYRSKKPLIIDFEYTINEWNEIQITDDIAIKLIAKYKGLTFKTFNKPEKYPQSGKSMAFLMAVSAYLGDHGDTSGQFSNHRND